MYNRENDKRYNFRERDPQFPCDRVSSLLLIKLPTLVAPFQAPHSSLLVRVLSPRYSAVELSETDL